MSEMRKEEREGERMIDRVVLVGNVVAVDVCGLMVRSVLRRGTRAALCLFLIIWEIIGWLACLIT